MNWPREYLKAIRAGTEIVSTKVKTVYEREVAWMESPPGDFPFVFDEERGEDPVCFIEEFCNHSKGRWSGKPVRLELFQKAKLQLAFGWVGKETGHRRFREIVDIRGRKCGKSTETAGVALYMLVGDGEGGAEIYCTANKKDQANLIFQEAVNMRQQSPTLRNVTSKRQTDIFFPATMSSMKALAADTKTMDGLNAHFFSLDEWHEARTRKVYDVMIQSQSAREQPLAWLISTNGQVRELFFDDMYNYASHVAMWDQGFEDYRVLPLIYELDSRDEWEKPECWAKANPGLGNIKSLETLKINVEKAKKDPNFLPTVLTKDFNIPENSVERWLPYEACVNETESHTCENGHRVLWSPADEDGCPECGVALKPTLLAEHLAKSYAIGGCDLSATTDLTCATLLICKPNDPNYYVLQHYFLPESRVKDVEDGNAQEAPYRLWKDQGHMTICEGATVDYRQVTKWFVDMVTLYDIRPLWIGYDRALAGYWVEEMQEYGFDMERWAQGPITWTYPMKRMGGLFTEKKIVSNNHPILRWCVRNTAKKTLNPNGIESIQPVKAASNLRIDGMVSLLNAFTSYYAHEDEFRNYLR